MGMAAAAMAGVLCVFGCVCCQFAVCQQRARGTLGCLFRPARTLLCPASMSCWRVLEGTVLGGGRVREGGCGVCVCVCAWGGYWQGVGIRHAEVYDWTLWQMLDLVTATTNTALNPTPPRTPLSLRREMGKFAETNETGNNGRLGCLTFSQIPPLFHSSGCSPDRLGGKPASLPACLRACLSWLVLASRSGSLPWLFFVNTVSLLPQKASVT